MDSQNSELLWDWVNQLHEQEGESLVIPQDLSGSNGSNGSIFEMVD